MKKYLLISILKSVTPHLYNTQLEKGTVSTSFVPYGQGSTEIKIENSDKTQDLTYVLPIQQEMLKGDVFSKELDGWKELHNWQKIDSYNGENITTDYISTTGSLTTGATVFYKLQTPKKIPCTEEQSKILNQLNALDLFEGVNDITTTENIALLQLKYVSNVDEIDILEQEIEKLNTTKVDKVPGKGLSTEDFTTEEKQKLAGLNNYDDTEIKKDIAKIQEEQTTQNQKIEKIEDNQIHIKTEQSSTINVQDCSNLSAKIDVYGVSSQETRSGKNKLVYPYKDLSGSIIEDLGDGRLKLNGTLESNRSKAIQEFLLKAGTYKLVFNKELLPNQAYFLLLNVDNGEYIISGLRQEGTFELSEDANVRLSLVLITGTYSNYELDLMILESTQQDETFEQYGASPSPEFPSEIENAGDNINYFDVSKITSGSIVINNNDGTLIIKNNPNTSGYVQQTKKLSELCPDLKVGDTATLGFKTTTKNSSYANSIYVGEAWNNGTYKTITQSMLDFQVGFYGGYNEISTISDIKIEKGTKATSYSKYGLANIDITKCNKNLFNKNIAKQDYILSATGQEIASPGSFISDYMLVKKGISYFSNTRGYSNAGFYDLNKNFIERKDLPQNSQFIPDNNYYIRLNGKIENIETLQFEIDNKSTEYTQHQSQTITFPLSEGQKMYEGSYTANDGIHHKRKQIELDGTENWFIGSIPSLRYPIRLELQDIKLKTTNLITEILSNCFLPVGSSENSTGYENKFTFRQANGSRNLWFFIPKNFFTTTTSTKILEEWKAYLSAQKIAGTPVTIEYPLAEEEIEAYTEEQQEAYNQLQNVTPYKLVTNISTDKAKLQFNYIADTKTYVDNEINSIKEQLKTVNELLSTTKTSAMLLDNMQTDLESEVL